MGIPYLNGDRLGADGQSMALGTKQATVLVVEDAPDLRRHIDGVLHDEGYYVRVVADGASALSAARESAPDVIVLDLELPDMDGIDVYRELRSFTNSYVIMLTGRCSEVDRLLGQTPGADAYLTKPLSPAELLARLAAATDQPRTNSAADPATRPSQRAGQLRVDAALREVRVGGVRMQLTTIEFDLLHALCERPRVVFSRQMLLERIRGSEWESGHHVVDVHVANLRKKIDVNGTRHIKTVRGVGYRLA